MRRSRERVVCNSDICLSEAPAEAEEIVCVTESVISIVCKKHQLRPKKQLFVTESVNSIVCMKHQLRPKKQLFVTDSVISIVCMKHQLRPKEQLFVTDNVISIVCMKHQLRPKKQLFVTESVISMKQELTVKKQLSVQHITQYSATRWQHSGT